MALQHFYSRVPAKVSMFNKAEGFDTFACSAGLDRDTIENSLGCVYNYKPTKEEVDLIRTGKLNPVYFSYFGKKGELIQACETFLPLDYTGERTSYMVHSLVLNDEEKRAVMHNDKVSVLNAEMFSKDLSAFDLTSFYSYADDAYPEKPYETAAVKSPKEALHGYDRDMLKRLIFSLLNLCCGKGKTVFLSLPCDLKSCSEEVLRFLNAITLIFPYHLRDKLSFVTYTGDPSKYPAFKIRGIVETSADACSGKGIVLLFRSRICLGLTDDAVRTEAFAVDFFHELIGNEGLRLEFLRFMDEAVKRKPALANTSFKVLKELLLIFCQCSGLFDEKKILPDNDSLQEFIFAYEKHREALTDEYRANAMVCLRRFVETPIPTAIPTKIFAKLVKMYPDETLASKHNIMKVMLELIHTDAMREKLFSFLKNAYPAEDEPSRYQIVDDLCRVYYGGFLRLQILDFFSEIFGQESETGRDLIFDKILLTVRTDAVRAKILAFISRYYPSFTRMQKEKFFITYLEMLREGDDLAKELSSMADSFIGEEESEFQDIFLQLFYQTLERDQRRKEPKIVALILTGNYPFLNRALLDKVCGEWSKRAIFGEYLALIWQKPAVEAIKTVSALQEHIFQMTAEQQQQFSQLSFDSLEAKVKHAEPTELLEVQVLLESLLQTGNTEAKQYFGSLNERILCPAICAAIPKLFSTDGGAAILKEYAASHAYVTKCDAYSLISGYDMMDYALTLADVSGFASACNGEVSAPHLKRMLSSLKKSFFGRQGKQAVLSFYAISVASSLADGKTVELSDLFDAAAEICPPGEETEDAVFDNDIFLLQTLIRTLNDMLRYSSDNWKEILTESCASLSGLCDRVAQKHKKKGEKWLSQYRKNAESELDEALYRKLCGTTKQSTGGGLFAKLFGRGK